MNYIEWNNALAKRYFDDVTEAQTFLCITKDTLKDISGLATEQAALDDFITAVKNGPEWTQISGCWTVPSKAHNCLHPDPEYRNRRRRSNEKKDLSGHIHWKRFGGWNKLYPPYLAYLFLFVLAWTEREDTASGEQDLHGSNYYEPLNRLLNTAGEDERISSFREDYEFEGNRLSLNDLWKDLEKWSVWYREDGKAAVQLPDFSRASDRFVFLPKYYGLMKAADLEQLNGFFVTMEEAGKISPDSLPPPVAFVKKILEVRSISSFLSKSCLGALTAAVNSEDHSLAEAFGRLLQSKYRLCDGLSDDKLLQTETTRNTRLAASLLRVMGRNGNLKLACRLRSMSALEKLPLEEGGEYKFEGEGKEVVVNWITGSEWFSLMEFPEIDLMSGMEIQCRALRIRASMPQKDYIVMHPAEPHFLSGYKVEVNEVEREKKYTLLSKGPTIPVFDGVLLNELNIACPQGMSCHSFSVPADASADSWPTTLPPLLDEKAPNPKLSFSGFRLEPRSARFPIGLPIRISCNLDNVLPKAKSNVQCEINEIDEGCWVLESSGEGEIVLSLIDLTTQAPPLGWQDVKISIESLYQDGARDRAFEPLLESDLVKDPYPTAFIVLEEGTRDPRAGEAVGYTSTYLEAGIPRMRVVAANIRETIEVYVDDKMISPSPGDVYTLAPMTVGDHWIKVMSGPLLLSSRRVRISSEPEFSVDCLSRDRNHPTEISQTLVADVRGDAGLVFDWEVRSDEALLNDGIATIDSAGVYRGVILVRDHAGLEAGKSYEVRFGFCGKFTASRWFRFKPGSQPRVSPSRGPASGGFNSLANALQGLSFPENLKEGGKP